MATGDHLPHSYLSARGPDLRGILLGTPWDVSTRVGHRDRSHTCEAKCSRGEPLLGNLVVKICGPCGKRAFGLFVCFETGFHGVAQADLKLFV